MTNTWLEAYRGQTVVVKYGGNAMGDDGLTRAFCEDIVSLTEAGIRVVITHGGGPQISTELAARGVFSEFRGGLRVTTLDAVNTVRDVLVRIGQELVTSLRNSGAHAVPIACHEQNVFGARKAGAIVDDVVVDVGQVGEVVIVDASLIQSALDAGDVPVVSAIGKDLHNGSLLNINADAAASSLAVALAAQWLLLLTDVDGLYRDWPNRDSLIESIDTDEVATLLPHLESGMIPKVAAAHNAVLNGVGHAVIVNGRVPHVLVSTPFGSTGTTITRVKRSVHD